jgi:hypothetical protein
MCADKNLTWYVGRAFIHTTVAGSIPMEIISRSWGGHKQLLKLSTMLELMDGTVKTHEEI